MTCEPAGPGWPVAPWPAGTAPWLGSAAASSLERADEAIATALRALVAADDVAWVSPAAARYRRVLAEGTDGVRLARVRLGAALAVTVRHDAAVELARAARSRDLAGRVLGGLLGGTG